MCDAIGDRTIESLVDLPFMDNPEMHAAMSDHECNSAGRTTSPTRIFRTVVCRLVKLMLLHGISEPSTHGCGGCSHLPRTGFQRHADGVRLAGWRSHRGKGRLRKRSDRVPIWRWRWPAMDAPGFGGVGLRWTSRSRTARRWAYLLFAGIGLAHRITNLIFRGDSLDEVWRETVAGLSFAEREKVRNRTLSDHEHAGLHPGDARAAGRSNGGRRCHVGRQDPACRVPDMICFHWILRMQRHFLLEDARGALEFAAKAAPIMWAVAEPHPVR